MSNYRPRNNNCRPPGQQKVRVFLLSPSPSTIASIQVQLPSQVAWNGSENVNSHSRTSSDQITIHDFPNPFNWSAAETTKHRSVTFDNPLLWYSSNWWDVPIHNCLHCRRMRLNSNGSPPWRSFELIWQWTNEMIDSVRYYYINLSIFRDFAWFALYNGTWQFQVIL